MSAGKLARLAGVPIAALAVVLVAFGAWPWSSKVDEPLDTEYMSRKLHDGLSGLSDADGRRTGEGQYVNPDITLEDAELAYKILRAVDPNERADEPKRGWFW